MLEINSSTPLSSNATFQPLGHHFTAVSGCFSANSDSVVIGGGYHSSGLTLDQVFSFNGKYFEEMQPLIEARFWAASISCEISLKDRPNYILVAGGCGVLYPKNSIEYLKMDEKFKSNPWHLCPDVLPFKASGHQLNILEGKLILTGGFNGEIRKVCNEVCTVH